MHVYCEELYRMAIALGREGNYTAFREVLKQFVQCIDETFSLDFTFHNTIVRILLHYISREHDLDIDTILSREVKDSTRLATRMVRIREIIDCLKKYVEENPDTTFAKSILEKRIDRTEAVEDVEEVIGNLLLRVYGRCIEPLTFRRGRMIGLEHQPQARALLRSTRISRRGVESGRGGEKGRVRGRGGKG